LVSFFVARLKQRQAFDQCVDAGVAADLDLTGDGFAAKVRGAQLRRREKQIGEAVDRDPKVLFRPRVEAVVAAKARFDVRDRYSRLGRAQPPPSALEVSPCTTTSRTSWIAAPVARATSRTWSCGSGRPGQPSSTVGSSGMP
jgi:hypothetical protein